MESAADHPGAGRRLPGTTSLSRQERSDNDGAMARRRARPEQPGTKWVGAVADRVLDPSRASRTSATTPDHPPDRREDSSRHRMAPRPVRRRTRRWAMAQWVHPAAPGSGPGSRVQRAGLARRPFRRDVSRRPDGRRPPGSAHLSNPPRPKFGADVAPSAMTTPEFGDEAGIIPNSEPRLHPAQ